MMDILSELQTVGLTALFNPTFLFLLILLFFLGKLVGWMTRNINIWKFLALAYFGIFLFRPLQDAGLIIGGVFILGVASMYMDLFRGIFGWAGGIGDVVSAFRFNGAYKDIQRLEREIEELKGQLRASQMAGAAAGRTMQQSSWRAQSQARKAKSQSRSGDDGAGSNGSATSNHRSGEQKNGSGKRSTSEKEKRYGKGRSSTGAKPTGKDGVANDGGKPSSSGSSKRGGSSSRKRSAASGSGSSQNQQQKTSQRTQSSSQSQSQQGTQSSASPSMSPALRDKYLGILGLAPGKKYTAQEIKAAWRTTAFRVHPDRGGTSAELIAAKEAYKALA